MGVTLAYSFSFNITFSVFIISAVVALLLINLQKRTKLAGDSLLGLLAHSTLAIGLVLIGFLTSIRFDLMGLLFGDILAVDVEDITLVYLGGAAILTILYFIWKPESFKKLVQDCKNIFKANTSVPKNLSGTSKSNAIFRRSIFVVKNMKKGEVFNKDNIRSIRPGLGLKPKFFDEILGKKASMDLERGEPLSWEKIIT